MNSDSRGCQAHMQYQVNVALKEACVAGRGGSRAHLQLPTISGGHLSDEFRCISPFAGVNIFSGVGSSDSSCTTAPA
jgi:hypothetical protein